MQSKREEGSRVSIGRGVAVCTLSQMWNCRTYPIHVNVSLRLDAVKLGQDGGGSSSA